jgi:hypothetical protein
LRNGFLAHRSRQGAKRRQKSDPTPVAAEKLVRDIRRATRKQYSAEEKIRIVLDGLRGESSIAELCRRENIAESLYYSWSKEFLEAGKRRGCAPTPICPRCREKKVGCIFGRRRSISSVPDWR